MSPSTADFHIAFCLSLTGLFALIFLTGCQPLTQAQTGTQTKTAVITPHQNKATAPAKQNQPTVSASTALTEEDIAATPLRIDDSSGEQLVNKAITKEAGPTAVKKNHSPPPEKDAVKPTFNPAVLVGRSHSYVSAQFGQADFKRTEGAIHVLQYRQPDCVIDLFINIAGAPDTAPIADARILDWAMRERTISQQLNPILCQQQFYERKL